MKTLKVVSISLGSSNRDHEAKINLLGKDVIIKRIGCDGNLEKAQKLAKTIDGYVDAIGIGGIDFYLKIFNDKYPLYDALKIKKLIQKTPVVDGSGLKDAIEPNIPKYIINQLNINPKVTKVFFVCATNRFSLAYSFENLGFNMIYGDLMIALKLPIPVKSLKTGQILAKIFAPIATKLLPYHFIYPTSKNLIRKEKYTYYFNWADIIAGDFNYILQRAPLNLKDKILVTTTVTSENINEMKERKVKYIITTYPQINGRAFGANVIEALLIALSEKKRILTHIEYKQLIDLLKFYPQIIKLN